MFEDDARAGEAVVTHAGEHHGEHAGAVGEGRGAKERVHGGAAMVLRRILGQVDRGRRAGTSRGQRFHVPVAARDVDRASGGGHAFLGLADAQRAAAAEALGEQAGKHFRHVLHDENRNRKILRKLGKKHVERRRTARGNADRQHLRLGRHTREQRRRRRRHGQQGAWRGGSGGAPFEVGGEGVNPGKQFLRQGAGGRFASTMAGGLGYIVAGPAGQRFDGDGGAMLGERAAHDHRHGVAAGAQLAQGREAVHHRHLHIEQNQVGRLEAGCSRGPRRHRPRFRPPQGRDRRG